MNSEQTFRRVLLFFSLLMGVFTLGVFVGMFLIETGYVPSPTKNSSLLAPFGQEDDEKNKEIAADLSIDYGEGNTQSFPKEILFQGSTVFDLLEAVERRHGVHIETREFPGLGVFIEAIHGVHNSKNAYWQYWVNGEYATVGAAQYILKDDDKILWKRTNQRED
ncbi:MAG: DUF4430 domain-containing protein [Patescibacteria group bacterium]